MPGLYEVEQRTMGVRQDISDELFNAQPEKTPAFSLIRSGKELLDMVWTYLAEEYPARALDGVPEGSDVTSFNSVGRTPLEGVAQWVREAWMVGKLANLKSLAAIADEAGNQSRKAMILLRIIMEKILLSDNECYVPAANTEKYLTRGGFKWVQPGVQAVKPVPEAFRPGSGTQYTGSLASLSESTFTGLLKTAAAQIEQDVDLDGFVGQSLKLQMDGWMARDTVASTTAQPTQMFSMDAEKRTLLRVVDFFKFSVGTVRAQVSYRLLCAKATGATSNYTARSGLFLNLALWRLRYMQKPQLGVLPDLGGGPRGYVDAVFGVQCSNPLGSASVYSATA